MELPIHDKNLAMEMAYAEKPYRQMAEIALSHEDQALQDIGLRIARLGITASTRIYYEETERQLVSKRYAEAQQKNINIAAYLEVATPGKYIADLRAFSSANAKTLGGLSRNFRAKAVETATELVLEREEEFNFIERQAGIGYQNGHYIGLRDLSTRMTWLQDKDNWKHAGDHNATLLLSYTRHILGFHAAANRASIQANGRIPSFDDLPEKLKGDTYDAITDEWFEYVSLAWRFGAIDKVSGKNRPLLYNSVDVLSLALNQERYLYASMSDSELVQVFEKAANFHYECEWVMKEKAQKNLRALEASSKRKPVYRASGGPTPAARRAYLEEPLDNEEQQGFVTKVDYERVLPIDDTADIHKVLKAIARGHAVKMNEAHGGYIGTASLFAGFNNDIFSDVRPKGFNGRIENTRMRHLPLSEEFVESYLKKRKLDYVDDIAVVSRIGVFSDLYSTGRGKIGEAMQEYVLYGRNVQNPHSRTIRITKLANLSGDKLVEYLNQESDKVAFTVERQNMFNPTSAGLPGLGKRR